MIRDFGPTTFIYSLWHAALAKPGATPVGALVLPASRTSSEPDSYFPDSARVAGPDPSAGSAWIDLSADLARALGAGPGDVVAMPAPVSAVYRVRSVYAARLPSAPFAAIAAAGPTFAAVPGTNDERFLEMLVRQSPGEVAEMLAGRFYQDRLDAGKVNPPTIRSRAELLANADERASASLALVAVLAAVALAGGVALAVREVAVFRRRARPTLVLLVRLGADPSALCRRVALAVGIVVATSLGLGGWLGLQAFTLGLVAPCFPPILLPGLLAAVGATGVVLELVLVLRLRASALKLGDP